MRYPILLPLLLLFGCAQMAANRRGEEYRALLASLDGRTEAEVIGRLGAPSDAYEADGLKVLTWRLDYGSRGGGQVSGAGTVSGHNVAVYDEVQGHFTPDGEGVWRMTDWSYRVQR
jgi:hypothetical protein